MTVRSGGGDDVGADVRTVRDLLRDVPDRGIAAGALRYLSDDDATRATMRALPAPDVLFNYLGQWDRTGDATLRLARPLAASFGERGARPHLFEVNAVVFEGRLRVDWTYSSACHERATVERLAADFRGRLETLIEHCRHHADEALTPEHFPDADLSQGELDDLLADFGDDD